MTATYISDLLSGALPDPCCLQPGSVGQTDLNMTCFLFYYPLSLCGHPRPRVRNLLRGSPAPFLRGLDSLRLFCWIWSFRIPVWRVSFHNTLWDHLAGLSLPQTLNSGCKLLLGQPDLASIDNSVTIECLLAPFTPSRLHADLSTGLLGSIQYQGLVIG